MSLLVLSVIYFSGPQLPGHGPVPAHRSFSAGPCRRTNNLNYFCFIYWRFSLEFESVTWHDFQDKVAFHRQCLEFDLKHGFIRTGDSQAHTEAMKPSKRVFWIKVRPENPRITSTALRTLVPFPTSDLCQAEFSAVAATKTSSGVDWT